VATRARRCDDGCGGTATSATVRAALPWFQPGRRWHGSSSIAPSLRYRRRTLQKFSQGWQAKMRRPLRAPEERGLCGNEAIRFSPWRRLRRRVSVSWGEFKTDHGPTGRLGGRRPTLPLPNPAYTDRRNALAGAGPCLSIAPLDEINGCALFDGSTSCCQEKKLHKRRASFDKLKMRSIVLCICECRKENSSS
jgi:hypothetical protein